MKYICEKCSLLCPRRSSPQDNNVRNFSPRQDSTESMVKFLNQPPIDDCPHLRQQVLNRDIIHLH